MIGFGQIMSPLLFTPFRDMRPIWYISVLASEPLIGEHDCARAVRSLENTAANAATAQTSTKDPFVRLVRMRSASPRGSRDIRGPDALTRASMVSTTTGTDRDTGDAFPPAR